MSAINGVKNSEFAVKLSIEVALVTVPRALIPVDSKKGS
jgi:hypothetical protein